MLEEREFKLIVGAADLSGVCGPDYGWGDIDIAKDEPTFGYENAWLVCGIHCEFADEAPEQAKAFRHALYDRAEALALDAGVRLVPCPDMSDEEFAFWYFKDPEVTLKVLTHPDAAPYLHDVDGTFEVMCWQIATLQQRSGGDSELDLIEEACLARVERLGESPLLRMFFDEDEFDQDIRKKH